MHADTWIWGNDVQHHMDGPALAQTITQIQTSEIIQASRNRPEQPGCQFLNSMPRLVIPILASTHCIVFLTGIVPLEHRRSVLRLRGI